MRLVGSALVGLVGLGLLLAAGPDRARAEARRNVRDVLRDFGRRDLFGPPSGGPSMR
jgi:hypothetical protein